MLQTRLRTTLSITLLLCLLAVHTLGQSPTSPVTVLRPARVFDGDSVHENWIAVVRGENIEAAWARRKGERSVRGTCDRIAGHDTVSRADRSPLPCLAAPL